MVTSLGEMTIALDAAAAPRRSTTSCSWPGTTTTTASSSTASSQASCCQGGDPTGTGRGGPGYKFADELPKPGRYELGSLAMANAGPNTNGSQFFSVSGPSGVRLPPQYSLFGKVVTGLDVVAAIESVDTDRGDRPRTDVVIESVTITEAD